MSRGSKKGEHRGGRKPGTPNKNALVRLDKAVAAVEPRARRRRQSAKPRHGCKRETPKLASVENIEEFRITTRKRDRTSPKPLADYGIDKRLADRARKARHRTRRAALATKALGVTFPLTLLGRADEVIE
jgi:hypothetical protein